MKMIIADVIVKLDKIGMTVRKNKVTPAEVAVLNAEHHQRAGGLAVEIVPDTENTIETSKLQVFNHLMSTYLPKRVKTLFPAASVEFPETFEEAIQLGMSVAHDFTASKNPLVLVGE